VPRARSILLNNQHRALEPKERYYRAEKRQSASQSGATAATAPGKAAQQQYRSWQTSYIPSNNLRRSIGRPLRDDDDHVAVKTRRKRLPLALGTAKLYFVDVDIAHFLILFRAPIRQRVWIIKEPVGK
jgi:hypothetical protein